MTMAPGLRKFVLSAHITVSVGWIGAVMAYIALDLWGARARDGEALRSAYLGMDLIARNVIVPLALASVLTGLVVSLATKWGLFRHYWVAISFVMTVIATVVLLIETRTIGALAEIAADPTTSVEVLRALPSTLVHSIGGTVVLLVVLVLNMYKPQGMTRYGWRKQQQERLRRQEQREAVLQS
jgi:hypothetical protein